MHRFFATLIRPPITVSQLPWGLYFKAWGVGLVEEPELVTVFLLCVFCGMLSCAFTAYHIYLIWAGTTTNETFKWDEWKEDIKGGEVYIADVDEREAEGFRSARGGVVGGGGGGGDGGGDGAGRYTEPKVPWPNKLRQVIVRLPMQEGYSREDGAAQRVELPREFEWRRVRKVTQMENLYDLGFWRNLKEVLRPRSY